MASEEWFHRQCQGQTRWVLLHHLRWMSALLRSFGAQALEVLATLVRLPQKLDSLSSKIDRGNLISRAPETEKRLRVLDSSIRRATSCIIFSTLIISGILLRNQGDDLGSFLNGASLVPLIYALGFFRAR